MRFRGQFLLTKAENFDIGWDKVPVKDYFLYRHPDLSLTCSTFQDRKLYLLGSIYDWERSSLSNQQLLDDLSQSETLEIFLRRLSKFMGLFVIVYCDSQHFIMLNDAVGQQEIYYDSTWAHIGSQTKILAEVMTPEPHSQKDATEFYTSDNFYNRSSLYVVDTTQFENIKRLLPNHYIDINSKKVTRFFPFEPIVKKDIKEVANLACQMLKGYLKAVGHRKPMVLSVTGGWDSRTLFLASLDEDCKYYLYKRKNMTDKHPDLVTATMLTQLHNREFEIIPSTDELYEDVSDSIDFPQKWYKPSKFYADRTYLDGNISPLARNPYGIKKKVTAKYLMFKNGYRKSTFIQREYNRWLDKVPDLNDLNVSVLNLFHWECQMTSNILATGRMQSLALGIDEISPYNSRDLLALLISVPQKHSRYYHSKLYIEIYKQLSPKSLSVPINNYYPCNLYQLLTKIGVYDTLHSIYEGIGIKKR